MARGLRGALFRYQLMANIVGVLIIPLFVFTGLHYAIGWPNPWELMTTIRLWPRADAV